MVIRFFAACFLGIFLSCAWSHEAVHCRKPQDDLPPGVLQALESTVTVDSTIALNTEHLNNQTATISTIGTGFIADTDGHVVVSGHRIANYLKASYPSRHLVITYDCRQFPATVVAVGGDEKSGVDAVLLKVDGPPIDFVPIKRAVIAPERMTVYVLGSPRGWTNTVYEGTLAGPSVNTENQRSLYAYIHLMEGISGGPLVTVNGSMLGTAQALGILTQYGTEMPVSFFVPTNLIEAFLREHGV